MSSIFTTELPVRNLLGVERAGLVTRSQSIPAAQGILPAGTLLLANGNKSPNDGSPHSVLAFDYDTGPAGTAGVVTVTTYLAGSFLRSTVEAASGFVVSATMEADLRAKGIFLERSIG